MGPTLPRLSPYLGVLHQAGHGLFCSTSICPDQPEGTERTALLARSSCHNPGYAGRVLAWRL